MFLLHGKFQQPGYLEQPGCSCTASEETMGTFLTDKDSKIVPQAQKILEEGWEVMQNKGCNLALVPSG